MKWVLSILALLFWQAPPTNVTATVVYPITLSWQVWGPTMIASVCSSTVTSKCWNSFSVLDHNGNLLASVVPETVPTEMNFVVMWPGPGQLSYTAVETYTTSPGTSITETKTLLISQ